MRSAKSKATISYTNITFLYCRSSTICTYGRTKMAVILIALFSLVYNIPRFFEVTWDTPTPIMVKKEIYCCHIQHLYDSSTHQNGHSLIGIAIFITAHVITCKLAVIFFTLDLMS